MVFGYLIVCLATVSPLPTGLSQIRSSDADRAPPRSIIRRDAVVGVTERRMPDPPPTYGGIILRPFRDTDVEMLRELSTDPYLPLIGSLPPNSTAQQAREFTERQHQRLRNGTGYSFCVAEGTDDHALGTAGLWIAGLPEGRATVGYSVAPSARGRGVAAKALRALTAFGWTIPELMRIELYVEPWNTGSIKVAESADFQREGLLRSHQPMGHRRADMLLYAMLRPEDPG
jgi:ribosomal-protein-alanine N-acetyltransferase